MVFEHYIIDNNFKLLQIDIDEDILERNKYKAQPLLVDYVKRRRSPFSIDVYKGSIDAQHDCLSDTDVVIGIEMYLSWLY